MGWSGRTPALPVMKQAGLGHRKEYAMSQKSSSEIAVIGIDIGKNSFHVVGQDRRGARVHKISPIAMLTARYNRIGRGRRVGRERSRNWTCKDHKHSPTGQPAPVPARSRAKSPM